MKIFFRLLSILLIILATFSLAQSEKGALLLNIKSAIGPATQDFIHRGLQQAAQQKSSVVILQIDTPGGLDKAMRGIISDISASPVPVVAYVAPSGARAASAGTFILYASSVAAMAPGTNLGAATPVGVGIPGMENTEKDKKEKSPSAMEIKAKQDAAAYIKSLAEVHGRNAQWAQQAVLQGVSLSANDALKIHVIDVIAKDIPDLLTQINGRKVNVQGQTATLDTTNLSIKEFSQDWRNKFLAVITDPSVAYILLMLGIWGLFFEFVNPGFVLPGVTGAICILLALYAFQLLPISYVGLGLILLGIAFLVAEAFVASFGVLGIGGIIALVIGSVLLLESSGPGFQIAWQLILAVTLATAAFFFLIINIALKARFRPIVSGREELIGSIGEVEIDSKGMTRARIQGELWQVSSDVPLKKNQKIKVVGMKGLTLIVVPQKTIE